MAKNLIPQIAHMLGVELVEEFKIEGDNRTYWFDLDGLHSGGRRAKGIAGAAQGGDKVNQCNIVLAGELKDKYHKTPNSITTDWRISAGAHRLYNLLLDLKLKQKYVTYEFLSSIIKKPNGKNLSVVTIKRQGTNCC